jgi:hypothetical protein
VFGIGFITTDETEGHVLVDVSSLVGIDDVLIIHRLEGFGQKEYNLDEDNGMIQMMDTTTVDIDIAVLEIANMSRTTMEERQQFLQGKTHPPGHGLQFHQLL